MKIGGTSFANSSYFLQRKCFMQKLENKWCKKIVSENLLHFIADEGFE